MDKSLKMIIESLLFAADKPLNEKDLHVWLHDAPLERIREALTALQSEYDEMDRSFALKEVAGGFQFRTRSTYAPYVIHMLKASPGRLSKAAMETLAIIAYKQPILRSEIERLRGVDVGGIVRTLLEKNLVRIMGRKNLPGKPLIYGTTRKFLEVFDLKDLDSLPKLKEIKDLGADERQITDTSEQVFPQEADRAEADSVAGPPDGGGEETAPESAEDTGPGRGEGGDAAEAESGRRPEEREDAGRAETDDAGGEETSPEPSGDAGPGHDQVGRAAKAEISRRPEKGEEAGGAEEEEDRDPADPGPDAAAGDDDPRPAPGTDDPSEA